MTRTTVPFYTAARDVTVTTEFGDEAVTVITSAVDSDEEPGDLLHVTAGDCSSCYAAMMPVASESRAGLGLG